MDRIIGRLTLLPIVLAVGICVVDLIEWALSPPARPVAEAPARRTLTDQTGHVLSLPPEVHRVGTPGISMASLILALSGYRKLTAVAPEVRANPWLQRVAPALAKLPTPFSRPAGVDLEGLLADKPDLVTLWFGNAPLARRLEEAGIPVLNMGYANPEEMKTAIRLLGQALGPAEQARAEALIRYYEDNLRRVATALDALPAAARPRVYYASIAPLHTEGKQSMIDAWIDAAGGINVAARGGLQGDVQVHLEDLLAWNPEIIVTLDAAQRRAILEDPRWQSVSAVRHGRVLVNPRGINAWCTRAAEAAIQVLWAAKMFHPERFPELDMNSETRRFYQQFYGYALNDDELARVLQGMDPAEARSATPARKKT